MENHSERSESYIILNNIPLFRSEKFISTLIFEWNFTTQNCVVLRFTPFIHPLSTRFIFREYICLNHFYVDTVFKLLSSTSINPDNKLSIINSCVSHFIIICFILPLTMSIPVYKLTECSGTEEIHGEYRFYGYNATIKLLRQMPSLSFALIAVLDVDSFDPLLSYLHQNRGL